MFNPYVNFLFHVNFILMSRLIIECHARRTILLGAHGLRVAQGGESYSGLEGLDIGDDSTRGEDGEKLTNMFDTLCFVEKQVRVLATHSSHLFLVPAQPIPRPFPRHGQGQGVAVSLHPSPIARRSRIARPPSPLPLAYLALSLP